MDLLVSFNQLFVECLLVPTGVLAVKFISISLTKKERQAVINDDVSERERYKLHRLFLCPLKIRR